MLCSSATPWACPRIYHTGYMSESRGHLLSPLGNFPFQTFSKASLPHLFGTSHCLPNLSILCPVPECPPQVRQMVSPLYMYGLCELCIACLPIIILSYDTFIGRSILDPISIHDEPSQCLSKPCLTVTDALQRMQTTRDRSLVYIGKCWVTLRRELIAGRLSMDSLASRSIPKFSLCGKCVTMAANRHWILLTKSTW